MSDPHPSVDRTSRERSGAAPVGPTAAERLTILRTVKRVAVVGASANPARASYFVLSYLISQSDYELYPVNPTLTEVLGLRVYPSLAELPEPPDLIDVFRRTSELPGVTDDAIASGASVLWFQLGLRDEASAARATEAGMTVVQDRCVKIEHARFKGGLHLAGFDTGQVSSRRARDLT